MPPVLEISDLSTHIQLTKSVVHAVGNVDLSIEPGEALGLVGESGCGKSMTGLSIMGLLPPGGTIVSGSIKLDGRELVGLSDAELRTIRGNDVAMIFQDPLTSLDPTKTIGYQVAEPVRLHKGASKAAAMARATEVLGLVGLPRPAERLGDYPHQLSGGMRQRVMIAMALSCEPKLLIADEPTTALDVTIQAQILALLHDLKDRLGMAMLLITHDMGVIAGHADRVQVMYAGRMVEVTDDAEPLPAHAPPLHPCAAGLHSAAEPGRQPAAAHDRRAATGPVPAAARLPVRAEVQPGHRQMPRPGTAADRGDRSATCSRAGTRSMGPPTPGPGTVRRPARPWPPRPAGPGGEAAAAPVPPLLEVRDLVKEFPVTAGAILQRQVAAVHAVSSVSFTVAAGETFGLVGESGCGKTTIGRVVVALERPNAGLGAAERPGHFRAQPGRAAQAAARPAADVPGSLRVPGPEDAGRLHHPRAAQHPACRDPPGTAATRFRTAR